jgi:hypothetical protein
VRSLRTSPYTLAFDVPRPPGGSLLQFNGLIRLLRRCPKSARFGWQRTPANHGLRYFSIPRFPNYVVFYRPLAFGVEILHILRGARDIKSILEAQEGEEEQE